MYITPHTHTYTHFSCSRSRRRRRRCCTAAAAVAAAAFTNWVIASIVVHWSSRCREWGHYELEIGWHMVLSFSLIVGSVWVYLSIASPALTPHGNTLLSGLIYCYFISFFFLIFLSLKASASLPGLLGRTSPPLPPPRWRRQPQNQMHTITTISTDDTPLNIFRHYNILTKEEENWTAKI